MTVIRKTASYILLISTYIFTWLVSVLGRIIPRRSWKPTGRIIVTGTIFNPNWYLSHITPLTRSGVEEVVLVVDEPLQPMEGVLFACPPKWLSKMISPFAAKAIWMLYAGIRYKPDLYMGYNLVAGGCTALVIASILGRPSCYQMTGGQLVLSTIDSDVETFEFVKAGKLRQWISKVIERLAIKVIKQFNLIIVRGNKGKTFLARYGIVENVAIITGSVKVCNQSSQDKRSIDLVFVGRLNPIKQVDQFIRIVKAVSETIPSVKAVIVGDGPLMESLKIEVERLGLAGNIEFLGKRHDVETILARSRVFVLTSKSEGSSIAMAEAMAAGVAPVVADVGELSDLVKDGLNGYLIEPNNIDKYIKLVALLLNDKVLWNQLSQRAIETSEKYCNLDIISIKWRQSINDVIERMSGYHMVPRINEQTL